jgi:hypothetical protein
MVASHVQSPRKASAEVSNLSNGEICSNYSLSICPRFLQPFTTLPEGQVPKALRSRISSSGTSRGPTIDVFNFGGGRYRTLPPAPPGAPPSMSSTSVVGAVGPCRQHLQGPRHRRLQLWWWALPDLAASTPRGPRHRRLQLRWWPLPDLAASTLGGPPSTSSTSVVGAVRPCRQHPMGLAIDIFNFGGGQRYKIWRTPKSHLVAIPSNFQKFGKIR